VTLLTAFSRITKFLRIFSIASLYKFPIDFIIILCYNTDMHTHISQFPKFIAREHRRPRRHHCAPRNQRALSPMELLMSDTCRGHVSHGGRMYTRTCKLAFRLCNCRVAMPVIIVESGAYVRKDARAKGRFGKTEYFRSFLDI